jgi:hypothetical protein
VIWSLRQPDLNLTIHPLAAGIIRGPTSWGITP